MNLFEAEKFFKDQNPDKNIVMQFDDSCVSKFEITLKDGAPNEWHYLEYNKVRISVGDNPSFYFPILTHREEITWYAIKDKVNAPGLDAAHDEAKARREEEERKRREEEQDGN